MKVEVADPVAAFIREQAPEPRKMLRLALRKLEKEQGDIQALEGALRGYSRLRVGPYRIVFSRKARTGGKDCVRCLFAERRDTIYAVFSQMVQREILEHPSQADT